MQYKYYKCLQKKFLSVQMSKSFIWIPIKRYKCCSGPNGMTWYEHMKHKPSYHVYRDQFNTASWHHVDIAPDFCAIRSVTSVLNHSTFEFQDFSERAPRSYFYVQSMYFWTLIPNHPTWRRVKMLPWKVIGKKLLRSRDITWHGYIRK